MNTPFKTLIIAAWVSSVPCAVAESLAFRPLFNGRDLTGWSGDGYIVEDGAIVCTNQGKNLVINEVFANYVLDFEFQLTAGANNGLGIHYPGTGDGAFSGMELQILDSPHPKYADLKPYQLHGGLYTLAAATQGALKPVGEWNRQRVTLNGSDLTVELNGKTILTANLDELGAKFPDHQGVKRRSGHIGWLGHGDRVSFRKIEIAELPPTIKSDATEAAGFIKKFDGTSLTGWKHSPEMTNWKAGGGILKHDGNPGAIKDLWTEDSFEDFTMVFDWRWSARGSAKPRPIVMPDGTENGMVEVEELDSGVYLRGFTKSQVNLWNWTVGSGEVYGYRTDPAMSPEVKAAVTPKTKADLPLGEWNRMTITLKGDVLTVISNGKVVIENAKLPGIPPIGPIGLQHHGNAIDFANIWIKRH